MQIQVCDCCRRQFRAFGSSDFVPLDEAPGTAKKALPQGLKALNKVRIPLVAKGAGRPEGTDAHVLSELDLCADCVLSLGGVMQKWWAEKTKA